LQSPPCPPDATRPPRDVALHKISHGKGKKSSVFLLLFLRVTAATNMSKRAIKHIDGTLCSYIDFVVFSNQSILGSNLYISVTVWLPT